MQRNKTRLCGDPPQNEPDTKTNPITRSLPAEDIRTDTTNSAERDGTRDGTGTNPWGQAATSSVRTGSAPVAPTPPTLLQSSLEKNTSSSNDSDNTRLPLNCCAAALFSPMAGRTAQRDSQSAPNQFSNEDQSSGNQFSERPNQSPPKGSPSARISKHRRIKLNSSRVVKSEDRLQDSSEVTMPRCFYDAYMCGPRIKNFRFSPLSSYAVALLLVCLLSSQMLFLPMVAVVNAQQTFNTRDTTVRSEYFLVAMKDHYG